MSRAEERRQLRLLGWRGAKGRHHSVVDPTVPAAVRQEIERRLAEKGDGA